MKRKNIILITAALTIAFMAFALALYTAFTPAPTTGTGDASGAVGSPANLQKIDVSFQNGNYYPRIITVKVNTPVELTGATNMPGCAGTIVMSEFGISKRMKPGDNVFTFTPTKTGDFSYTCSMGMYKGTIRVVA